MKEKIVVIVGPTASGKSDLAVELALLHDGEIISADSRQVYAGLDIGSGKITEGEMKGVPHYMLDMADPMDVYSVSDFKFEAGLALGSILKKGKTPFIVGGTFFYVDTLVYDVDLPEVPPNESLRAELEEKSLEELLVMLDEKDPDRGESVDRYNKRRVIRALEIIDVLGVVPPNKKDSPYDVLWVGIETGDELRGRIEKRLDRRIEEGMLKEVERLLVEGVTHARLQELGLEYKYSSLYLRGEITMDEMKEILANKIWQYSKRQKTWLKKNKSICWFKLEDTDDIKKKVKEFLSEK